MKGEAPSLSLQASGAPLGGQSASFGETDGYSQAADSSLSGAVDEDAGCPHVPGLRGCRAQPWWGRWDQRAAHALDDTAALSNCSHHVAGGHVLHNTDRRLVHVLGVVLGEDLLRGEDLQAAQRTLASIRRRISPVRRRC